MFNEKINALSEQGEQAATHAEYLSCQIAIANIVAEGISECTRPITGVSAAPVVMVLEQYAKAIRKAIDDDDALDEEIAELQQGSALDEFRLDLG